MFSRRENEGYVLIDHRESMGFTEAECVAARLSPLMPIGKGQRLEAPTFTCSHCDRVVVMNPLRNRDRAICFACDHNICDACETNRVLTGECNSRQRRIDAFLARVTRGGDAT